MIVGKIVKPQGIKGEVKIEPMVADNNLFQNFQDVLIDGKTFTIKSARVHQGFVYLAFNEVHDRNSSEALRGKMVEVSKHELPNLENDFYYIADLEGCEIFFEDGEKFGKIYDVQNFGASDVLFIKSGSEEVLCPFLKKVFVEVDVHSKKIIANKKLFLEVTQSED